MTDRLIVNLALTGMVAGKADNPWLPESVREIAEDCVRCCDLGVSIVHVHARTDGAPDYRKETYRAIVRQIRESCPDLVICVSCSGRTFPDIAQRADVLELSGDDRPDLASLTLGSLNFPRQPSINSPETIASLARRMRENGIKPELEAFEVGMVDTARRLLAEGVLHDTPPYLNLFFGSRGTLDCTPLNLGAMLAALPPGSVWSAAGIGRHQLAANLMAIAAGGHVRTGLEDNLYMDVGRTDPASNVRLVERVVAIARAAGREPATPREARLILGLTEQGRA